MTSQLEQYLNLKHSSLVTLPLGRNERTPSHFWDQT